MREFLFLTLLVISGTGGELCVTHAMKKIGEVHDFHPLALVKFILRALRVGWMWLGIAMMAAADRAASEVHDVGLHLVRAADGALGSRADRCEAALRRGPWARRYSCANESARNDGWEWRSFAWA